jgi:hypothetical protein
MSFIFRYGAIVVVIVIIIDGLQCLIDGARRLCRHLMKMRRWLSDDDVG